MLYKEKYLKYKYKNSKIISEINDIIATIKISSKLTSLVSLDNTSIILQENYKETLQIKI